MEGQGGKETATVLKAERLLPRGLDKHVQRNRRRKEMRRQWSRTPTTSSAGCAGRFGLMAEGRRRAEAAWSLSSGYAQQPLGAQGLYGGQLQDRGLVQRVVAYDQDAQLLGEGGCQLQGDRARQVVVLQLQECEFGERCPR